MPYDVVIVGGGPAGLSASLTLGRARKRVLLCDAGARRNAAATHIHNFVTRDGTPPDEFRRIAREQLTTYPNVEVRDARIEAISGSKGAFRVTVGADAIEARRILLCAGMIDQVIPIDGFRELWGHTIFQCPYCHGWEVRERRWGCLVHAVEGLHFAENLLGWTRDLVVFTDAAFDVPAEWRDRFHAAGARVETSSIARLVGRGSALSSVVLSDGTEVPRDVLFAHPPQRQIELVAALGLALDADGFVVVDPMSRETSVAGIYAAGDLTTRMQAAIAASASAVQAAAMINYELTSAFVRNVES